MTLTEQWKKGELEQGYYYTKYTPKVGKPFVEIELRNYLLDLAKVRDADTVEVLAPVPSYEDFKRIIDDWRDASYENKKLKELLKECRDFFYENLIDTEFYFFCGLGSDIKKQSCIKSLSKLKTKIDEVLK